MNDEIQTMQYSRVIQRNSTLFAFPRWCAFQVYKFDLVFLSKVVKSRVSIFCYGVGRKRHKGFELKQLEKWEIGFSRIAATVEAWLNCREPKRRNKVVDLHARSTGGGQQHDQRASGNVQVAYIIQEFCQTPLPVHCHNRAKRFVFNQNL